MIKYILSHPIQYQVPLIRFLSKRLKIKVNYRINTASKKYYDKGFNKKILIDNKLLSGYDYKFLKFFGPNKIDNFFPLTYEFIQENFSDDSNIIWIHGSKNWYNLIVIFLSFFFNKKVFLRDELNFIKRRNFFNYNLNKLFYIIIDPFIKCYLSIGKINDHAYKIFGIKKHKIFNVPYVVDNKRFYVKNKRYNKKITILFVGKLIHKKGCDLFLKSIIILNKDLFFRKNVIIDIIGDGILKSELINFKKEKNLKNVNFLGFKDQNSIKKYYKKSHIFVMPSREENWGLSVNEAMCSKNAIILSKNVGCRNDLLKKNFNGFYFKNNDHKDLAKQISKLYKNKNKIKKFGQNSFKIISKWTFQECLIGLNNAIKYASK